MKGEQCFDYERGERVERERGGREKGEPKAAYYLTLKNA